MESQEGISKFISKIRETSPGDSLSLSILRTEFTSQRMVELEVTPQLKTSLREVEKAMTLGVVLAPNYVGTEFVKASSLPDALSKAGVAVTELTVRTATSLSGIFASFVSGKGVPAGQSLSGPIGVVKVGSDVISSNDFSALLTFIATISINLAVFNSLPLPSLDGGQLLFLFAETVSRKKFDQQAQELINVVALFFLLIVSVSTSLGDILNIAFKF